MTSAQFSMFGDAPDRLATPARPAPDHPARVRVKLGRLLARLRDASTMPLTDREIREWTVLVPQMSNWLPPEEAEEVRGEFAREMERLRTARSGSDPTSTPAEAA